jgi:hypothetical protein
MYVGCHIMIHKSSMESWAGPKCMESWVGPKGMESWIESTGMESWVGSKHVVFCSGYNASTHF